MKILMVNKFLYPNGGSETYVFKIGEQLIEMGHQVQYFGMEHPDRIVSNHVGSYTSNMDFHTGKLNKLMYPFKIIYSTEARKKIKLVLEDFKPDVVHLNNFNFQITPSVIYEIRKFERKNKSSISIIFTAHDYQWVCPNHMFQVPSTGELCTRCLVGKYGNCIKYKCVHSSRVKSILGALEAFVYKRLKTYGKIDKIICPSEFMNQMLSKDELLRERTVTMHNFIDERENNREKTVFKEDYVLYFGRYAEQKGIKTLLEVCKRLPEIPFVFAGSGALEKEINKVNNIENRGFLTGKELHDMISKARFVVFPSEWYENCPFSVMEAQMYGTPVIGTDIGGTPELISEGKTGLLFSCKNEDELCLKINQLWQDKELCADMSAQCSGINFDTTQEYCRKLLEIYSEAGK